MGTGSEEPSEERKLLTARPSNPSQAAHRERLEGQGAERQDEMPSLPHSQALWIKDKLTERAQQAKNETSINGDRENLSPSESAAMPGARPQSGEYPLPPYGLSQGTLSTSCLSPRAGLGPTPIARGD